MHNSFMRWPKGICIFHGTLPRSLALLLDRHAAWPKTGRQTDRGTTRHFWPMMVTALWSVGDLSLTWASQGTARRRLQFSNRLRIAAPCGSTGISDISRLSRIPLRSPHPPTHFPKKSTCPNSLNVCPLPSPLVFPSLPFSFLSVCLLSIISTFGALHSFSRKLTDGAVIVVVVVSSTRQAGRQQAGNIPYVENSIFRTIACTMDVAQEEMRGGGRTISAGAQSCGRREGGREWEEEEHS